MISIPRLVKEGCHFVFKKNICLIIAPDQKYLQVEAGDDGMFYLSILRRFQRALMPEDFRVDHEYNVNTTEIVPKHKTMNINDIHDKFGYVGETVSRRTMKHLGYTVTGTLASCDACKMAKARAKKVKKQTETRSTIPGERIYIDLSGPFSPSIGGSQYWV